MMSIAKVCLLALIIANFDNTNSQQCSDLSHEKLSVSSCQDRDWQTSAGYDQDQSVACTSCTQGLNDVAIALGRNDDEDSIKNMLNDNCSLIADQSKVEECQRLVASYMDEIKDVVKRAVNRWVVCGMLKMCQNMSESSGGQRARNPLLQNLQMDTNDSPACSNCQTFVLQLKDPLSKAERNSKTAELQRSLFDDICARLTPSSDSPDTPEKCMLVTTNSLPLLLKAVADLINPLQLCQDAMFCDQSSASSSNGGPNKYAVLCTNLVNTVEQNEPTIGSVIQAQICNNLSPGNAKTICTEANLDLTTAHFVNVLFDTISLGATCGNAVRFGYNGIDGQQQQQQQPQQQQTAAAASGTAGFCSTCNWIVQQFDKLYAKPPVPDPSEIPGYFDRFCHDIPPAVGSLETCQEFSRKTDPSYVGDSAKRRVLCSIIGCA